MVPAGDPEGDLLIVGLGLDLWLDYCGAESAAREGHENWPCSSALSESFADESGRGFDRYKQCWSLR